MKDIDICRYCGGIIRLVPARAVYGESTERLGMTGEYIYQCQNCNARVGCHKGTTRALGNVTNEVLLKRDDVHQQLAIRLIRCVDTYDPAKGELYLEYLTA